MVTRKLTLFWLPIFLFLSFGVSHGQEYKQSRSLPGLTSTKVYFDVNMGIAKKLLLRLSLIDKTLSQLQSAGIQPEIVIAFRGKASKFVTRGRSNYVVEEEQSAKAEVHKWLKTFAQKGILMEQCLIAAELQGIAPEDFRPELEIVKNGYISMLAHQNRGFAQIPMD